MYLGYQNGKIRFYTEEMLNPAIYQVDKQEYTEDVYVLDGDEYVLKDEAWEAKQAQKEKYRIQKLFMTRSDFFDGTIDAWGVGEDELLFLVQRMLTGLPLENNQKLKAINNFKNALNFYRKHDLFKMLIGVPIQLTETMQVIITEEALDKYFDEVAKGNKDTAWQYLPQPTAIPIEPIPEETPIEEPIPEETPIEEPPYDDI